MYEELGPGRREIPLLYAFRLPFSRVFVAPALPPLAVFASEQHVSLPHTALEYLHATYDNLLGRAELLPGRMLPGLEGEMGRQADGGKELYICCAISILTNL